MYDNQQYSDVQPDGSAPFYSYAQANPYDYNKVQSNAGAYPQPSVASRWVYFRLQTSSIMRIITVIRVMMTRKATRLESRRNNEWEAKQIELILVCLLLALIQTWRHRLSEFFLFFFFVWNLNSKNSICFHLKADLNFHVK